MDIRIEAPQHSNFQTLEEYFIERINKKFGSYDFVKIVDVKLKFVKNDNINVSVQITPKNGGLMFATSTATKEAKAMISCLKKLEPQIEKYKQVHYKNY